MIARILVQSLVTCLAIRDDLSLHGAYGKAKAVIITDSQAGTVPLAVNAAIRKVNGRVARKLKAIKAQLEAVQVKETAAEEALQKKNATLEAVESHSEKYTLHAKKSREAFAALEDAMDLHSSKNSEFEEAKEKWKTLDASVLQATEALDEKKAETQKLMEEKQEELQEMETALDGKKAKRDEAEELLKTKEGELKEAGEFKKNKASEHDKAEEEMHEARKALEKNQLLLDEAMNALEMAKAKVLEAKAQHKLLEEEQGDEKKGLEMLLKVRAAIETFYGKLDELTASMESQIEEQPGSVASQLLREDPHLKPALEGYNKMVEIFYELHGLDTELYGSIRDAVAQIKRNTFAAILLQCDPGEKLEMEAEDKKDFSDLQDKCGTGLWKAAGVKRSKFPTFKGKSEQIADAWWDASLETETSESTDEQLPETQAVEAMETPTDVASEVENTNVAPMEPEESEATTKTEELPETQTESLETEPEERGV